MIKPPSSSLPPARSRPPEVSPPPAPRLAVDDTIWPAAIIPVSSARALLAWLAADGVDRGGLWSVGRTTGTWQRYDKPWNLTSGTPDDSELVGTVSVTYNKPREQDLVLHQVQVTGHGLTLGWSAISLVDELLGQIGLSLDACSQDASMPTTAPMKDPFQRADAYHRGAQ